MSAMTFEPMAGLTVRSAIPGEGRRARHDAAGIADGGRWGESGRLGDASAAGLRLTRRGRLVLTLLAILLAMGVLAIGGRALASGPEGPVPTAVHVVRAGDSLWRVASGVASPAEDVRDVIEEIRELNDLASVDLRIGQALRVPVRA